MTPAVVGIIVVALAFDFVNGFHDAANSIATVVSTRVLPPRLAVAWAAFFNFAAFLIFGTAVAATIAKTVKPEYFDNQVIFAGLIGAIAWDLMTWVIGLPTSSSHALVGAMAGAAVAKGGWQALVTSEFQKIIAFIVLSPILGFLLGFTLLAIVYWIFHRYQKIEKLNRGFRKGQLFSAAAFSLAHGANDAQKTMGVIFALLIANGLVTEAQGVPLWVVLAAHTAIALGTLFGGWRIVHTMGSKITKLQPSQGMAAETAAAVTIMANTLAGIPVSTTHTITGAIVGVGTSQRLSAVRWGIASRVVWAWVLTIPGAFIIAFFTYRVIGLFT
jgi:PiT family inorganic phosphate transporter